MVTTHRTVEARFRSSWATLPGATDMDMVLLDSVCREGAGACLPRAGQG